MKDSRRIFTIVIIFAILIFLTLLAIIKLLYNNSNMTDDILENSMDIVFAVFLALPFILSELDFMYNTLYFFSSKKTIKKTIFNIIICLILILIILATINCTFSFVKVNEIILLVSLMIYFILRITYIILIITKKI